MVGAPPKPPPELQLGPLPHTQVLPLQVSPAPHCVEPHMRTHPPKLHWNEPVQAAPWLQPHCPEGMHWLLLVHMPPWLQGWVATHVPFEQYGVPPEQAGLEPHLQRPVALLHASPCGHEPPISLQAGVELHPPFTQ
jgi:hypothetical protein